MMAKLVYLVIGLLLGTAACEAKSQKSGKKLNLMPSGKRYTVERILTGLWQPWHLKMVTLP